MKDAVNYFQGDGTRFLNYPFKFPTVYENKVFLDLGSKTETICAETGLYVEFRGGFVANFYFNLFSTPVSKLLTFISFYNYSLFAYESLFESKI